MIEIGTLPPTKNKRAQCWAARDLYFVCLDDHDLWLDGYKPSSYNDLLALDPTRPPKLSPKDKNLTKEQKKSLFVCQKAREFYEKECLPSWALHFSMLRLKDLQKSALVKNEQEKEKSLHVNDDAFWEKVSRQNPTKTQ